MKSVKLQFLVTLVAVLTAVGLYAAKGQPPKQPIVIYIENGDGPGVRRALNWGADVNFKPEGIGGWVLLHAAVDAGYKDLAELLISRGAEINAQMEGDGGSTALHMAARKGFKEIVELLIVKGADVKARDNYGRTPLSVTVRTDDRYDRPPLSRTIRIDHQKVVEYLIAQGGKVNVKDSSGMTPLHWAACMNQTYFAAILLSNGANVNARNNYGFTPLGMALLCTSEELAAGRGAVADLLRQHGAKE
jgi:ankyrin repeat protein